MRIDEYILVLPDLEINRQAPLRHERVKTRM